MIDEVVTGVLVNAIAAAGRRLGAAAGTHRGRRNAEDQAIVRWFDTYRLTERIPEIPELFPGDADRLAGLLRSDEVQAALHELLAARLTDAPEADVGGVRTIFGLILSKAGHAPVLGEVLFDYFDGEICALVGRLEGTEPGLMRQIRGEALAVRMIAVLHAIERHAAALAVQPDVQAEAGFLASYRRHVTEYHGRIEPPDFERRRRVAIADLYVPPPIFQMIKEEPGHQARKIDLWTLAGEIDRTVLVGDPGGGKTTAANVLMHHYAGDPRRPVPFLVTLREFADHGAPERSVVRHLEHKLDTFYQCPAPHGSVARLLLTGRGLVIFDGMDELTDTSRRGEVTNIIERFATEYPLARVLVTSRLVGYDQARLDERQFIRFRIGWLDDGQVRAYVRKWFAQEEDVDPGQARRWAEAFMDESGTVMDLRANPLMLALMCILYRGEGSLPRNRVEVYEQCASLLFRKWDARRRIHLDLSAGHLLEPALRHLAWWMFTRSQAQPAVTERELVDQATAFLYGRGFETEVGARESAAEFIGFCRGRMWVFSDVGTTAVGEPLYGFTHRTFLEYFAAQYLSYVSDTPEQLARSLAPHVVRHEWEVVGELSVQIKDHTSDRGAQRIYATLLNEHRRRRSAKGRSGVLQFLARCLRSVDPPPREIRGLIRQVLDHLFAGDPDDPVRCLPLCWLLASCTTCRDIVDEEIGVRVAALVESGDPADHLNGLHLVISLPVGISGFWGSEGPHLSQDSPQRRFWNVRGREHTLAYADSIIDASVDDTGLRSMALWHELIDVDRALKMPNGLITLFQRQWIGILGWWQGAYLLNAVGSLALGGPDAVSKATSDLAVLGRYLVDHPRLPWIAGEPDAWSEFFWGHPVEQDIPRLCPGPVAYLGAAATLLIATEGMRSRIPLNDLYPYIARRWGSHHRVELPDLPIPEDFRQTFHDWAENKINFVDPHAARTFPTSHEPTQDS
jgi:NACHT domain